MHPGIRAWALGCEPPVSLAPTEREAYFDEADRFYADPRGFLEGELGRPRKRKSLLGGRTPRRGLGLEGASGASRETPWDGGAGKKMWPDYLVFFEGLEPVLSVVAGDSGYDPCWRGWNSWFHDDWRRKGDVVVWCVRGGRGAG